MESASKRLRVESDSAICALDINNDAGSDRISENDKFQLLVSFPIDAAFGVDCGDVVIDKECGIETLLESQSQLHKELADECAALRLGAGGGSIRGARTGIKHASAANFVFCDVHE